MAALIKAQINSNTFHNSLDELLQGTGNTDMTNLGKTKDLSGIVLDDTDFSKIKNIQGFTFVGSNFTKSNFANIEVQNSSFVNSVFQKGVSFAGSELQDVDFSNAKFSGYQIEELYLPRRTQTTGKIEKDAKEFRNEMVEFKDEMLSFEDKALKDLEDLKQEKTVSDEQDKRQKKVLQIHNDALKSNKVLSEHQSSKIDGLRVF